MAQFRVRERAEGSPTQGAFVRPQLGVAYPCDRHYGRAIHICEDVVGNPYGDNPLTINHSSLDCHPMVLNTPFQDGSYFTGHPVPTNFSGNGDRYSSYHLSVEGAPSSVLHAKLLARTNPSRPTVDLPVLLGELKDLPRMIKQAGDAIRWLRDNKRDGTPPTANGVASANLAYQFGWVPLLDDLKKLFSFQEQVAKKQAELDKLYSGKGLRRNVKLESVTVPFTYDDYLVHSAGFWLTANIRSSTTYTSWGSVRYKPLFPFGKTRPGDREAFIAALGLDVTLSTIWELLPWSWLIDYFTNLGDILAAYRNTIPTRATNICIMRKLETVHNYSRGSGSTPNISWAGATGKFTTKKREVVYGFPAPTAYLPFLSGKQLSILGSLAITRVTK